MKNETDIFDDFPDFDFYFGSEPSGMQTSPSYFFHNSSPLKETTEFVISPGVDISTPQPVYNKEETENFPPPNKSIEVPKTEPKRRNKRSQSQVLPPPHLNRRALEFVSKCLPSAKSVQFLSLGSFVFPPPFIPQFINNNMQIVANASCCRLTLLGISWITSVHYLLLKDEETVLEFRVQDEETGITTSLMETKEHAQKRTRTNRTQMNKAFTNALLQRQAYFQQKGTPVDMDSAHKARVFDVAANGKPKRRCTESVFIFGLRDSQMLNHVVAYYQDADWG